MPSCSKGTKRKSINNFEGKNLLAISKHMQIYAKSFFMSNWLAVAGSWFLLLWSLGVTPQSGQSYFEFDALQRIDPSTQNSSWDSLGLSWQDWTNCRLPPWDSIFGKCHDSPVSVWRVPCPTKWWSVHNHKISFFSWKTEDVKTQNNFERIKKKTL